MYVVPMPLSAYAGAAEHIYLSNGNAASAIKALWRQIAQEI